MKKAMIVLAALLLLASCEIEPAVRPYRVDFTVASSSGSDFEALWAGDRYYARGSVALSAMDYDLPAEVTVAGTGYQVLPSDRGCTLLLLPAGWVVYDGRGKIIREGP